MTASMIAKTSSSSTATVVASNGKAAAAAAAATTSTTNGKRTASSSAAGKKVEKPKRPLSAYNLFYRFKRAKILEAHKAGDDSEETITRLVTALPGLEEHDPAVVATLTQAQVDELSRAEIRAALVENLSPKDTRNRTHRKSHGALTFLEMNKIMVGSWKSIDETTRQVFEELAEEGRRMYHKRVAEYEATNPAPPSPPKKKVKSGTPGPLLVAKPGSRKSSSPAVHKPSGAKPSPIAAACKSIPPSPKPLAIASPSSSPTPMEMGRWGVGHGNNAVVTPPKVEHPRANFCVGTTAGHPYGYQESMYASPGPSSYVPYGQRTFRQQAGQTGMMFHRQQQQQPACVSPVSSGRNANMMMNFGMTNQGSNFNNQPTNNANNGNGGNNKIDSSFFDSLDLDLESDRHDDGLPPFFDIFDDVDTNAHSNSNSGSGYHPKYGSDQHRSDSNSDFAMCFSCNVDDNERKPHAAASSNNNRKCVLDEFPDMPFAPVDDDDEEYAGEASVDDFMELIATLDAGLAA